MPSDPSLTVTSITASELAFVAGLDYRVGEQRHLDALRQVIFRQQGIPHDGQHWFPYEVIELGSNQLQTGHEREFAICTLLVLAAVGAGFDKGTDLSQKFHDHAADYDALAQDLRDEILDAYARADLDGADHLLSSYRPAE